MSAAKKIDRRITSFSVGDAKAANDASTPPAAPTPMVLNETVDRPEVLLGSTYKIKSPLFEHALYVTINDIVLNSGTDAEVRRPFELFINSKNMEHFQWIVALTRIMSAVFRKGGDVTFMVEELRAVFDPRGGYFKSGGVYMPSIVAELGATLQTHLETIGLLKGPELRLGKIRRCLAQNFVRLAQLTVLALQCPKPFQIARRRSGAHAAITLRLAYPATQHLCRVAHLRADRTDHRSLPAVLVLVLKHHLHGSLLYFW